MKRTPEQVTIHEAKTHLSKLLVKVSRGQIIIIKNGNRAVAQLVPIVPTVETRQFGLEQGKIQVSKDFELLPDSILKHFKR